MAIKKVTLSYASGVVTVSPSSQSLGKDDWISFVTVGASIFTVIINDANYFNTSRRVLMYEVYDGHSADTPTTQPNNTSVDIPIDYIVYATDSDNTDGTTAPPRIIISPHA